MKPKNELNAEEAAVLLGKKVENPSKFHNRKTTLSTFFGEQTFDSIKEARCFQKLELALKAGHYRLLLCQVPFRLPGKTRYVADFLAVSPSGEVHILDAKGMKTAMYQLKKRQVEEIYRIQIEEL